MAIYYIFFSVIAILYFTYYFLLRNKNYWKTRNVPFVDPLPFFGNFKDSLLLKRHMNLVEQEICRQFPNEPYVGAFYGTEPALIVQDPSLLKLVLSKEFYFCNGRETSDYNDRELLSKNMFFAYGDEWKVLRTNLTPLFTSAKLKNMFYLINNYADNLERLLAEEIETDSNIEIRNLLSKYTIGCISACAFGVCSDTMKKNVKDNPFVTVADQIFDTSAFRAFKNIGRSMWPGIFYALGFKLLEDDVRRFFNDLLCGVFRKREETKSSKNDFVDLILNWKRENSITGDTLSNIETGEKKKVSIEVNDELLISQCVLFFAAGFETTSTSISFLVYELAKNKAVQERVIQEVDDYFAQHKEIEYECINRMPFLESCLEESLRLYPVLGVITREVIHDYTLPTGLRFAKGDRIHIPIYHIQRNPLNFPEPEEFRPERFFGEGKQKNIKPYTYMPFGEGPRICIGMRFAKMPIFAAVLKIFKKYRVELAENMTGELVMNPRAVITQTVSGIHVKFIPRKDNN